MLGSDFCKVKQTVMVTMPVDPANTTTPMLPYHPPYHSQMDRLVERCNIQTLNSMLSRFADEDGKDWDKMIPYILFAYRKVPHATTVFSF